MYFFVCLGTRNENIKHKQKKMHIRFDKFVLQRAMGRTRLYRYRYDYFIIHLYIYSLSRCVSVFRANCIGNIRRNSSKQKKEAEDRSAEQA